MVFVPTESGRDEDAEPDATVVPFTVTVELGWVTVGVTVVDATANETDEVYEVVPETKEGVIDPPLSPRLASVVSLNATAGEYLTIISPDPPAAPAAAAIEEPLSANAAPPPPPPVLDEPLSGADAA
jgi:hypothetical protein